MSVWKQRQAVPAFRDDEVGGLEFRTLDLRLDQTQDYPAEMCLLLGLS
jgi:hypothetical protein